MTIDNPVDMNELTVKSGGSPQKAEDVHERSRTLPLKVYSTHCVSSFPFLVFCHSLCPHPCLDLESKMFSLLVDCSLPCLSYL